MQLPVHLRDEQFVVFNTTENQTIEQLQQDAKETRLTAFFKANTLFPAARQLLYIDMPSKFIWNAETNEWLPRKKGRAFGRISFVPPNAGEKFYARLILSVVKNLQSFDDLQFFEGVHYPTIREACFARGLLDNDDQWKQTLDDAKGMQIGPKLRMMFVMIVRECTPTQPMDLWHRYKSFICDDLRWQLQKRGFANASEHVVHDFGLHLIEQALQRLGSKTMKDVGLSRPLMDWCDIMENTFFRQHLSYNPKEQLNLLLPTLASLNVEQRDAFNKILDAALACQNSLFFLHGGAGSGKTFVYTALCRAMRSRGLIALCVASSGIASILLPGGSTAHSFFKIPIDLDDRSMCAIGKTTALATFLKSVRLLIWDECSMQHRHAFEAVDRTLQDVRERQTVFGGIPAVLGGDFLQILPVVKRGTRSDVVHATLIASNLWHAIAPNVLKLRTNMRLTHDDENHAFASWQTLLAHGCLNDKEERVEIPPQLLLRENTVAALLDHTYPDIALPQPDEYFKQRCILSSRNRECHELNNIMLEKFPGDALDLWAIDTALDRETQLPCDDVYTQEVLHALKPAGYPVAHLRLKKGCPVILLRNLDPHEGLCNGSRGIVTQITLRVLEIRLLEGETVVIPRIKLISTDLEMPFNLHRIQFPVSLSFAMTIHKAQGQSFDTVGIDLRNEVFSHGQLYVALSRGRNVASIKCLLDSRQTHRRTKNVVFREVII